MRILLVSQGLDCVLVDCLLVASLIVVKLDESVNYCFASGAKNTKEMRTES